ncbi:MAG: NAD-dependent epimerase/dehydratase family protein [Chloroflexi bacterium]|nr:NAD-dependent epimerase/dehydratase family protein [Chloroflexota bacterium]
MRVAVTGGSGAIGRYVCDELTHGGHNVVSVDRVPPRGNYPFIEVDLLKREETLGALNGFDAVVHLAAIPDPYSDPPEVVIGENTVSTFNVLEAVRENGVQRVVYGCSDSSTGFGIHNVALKPLYLPVDEQHPLWPHESYSLSKHFGERMAQTYAKAYRIEAISLRYQFVLVERSRRGAAEQVRRAREGIFDPKTAWFGGYISVRDVARACLAGVDYRFEAGRDEPFEAFFLSARNTLYPVPTLEVAEAIWGDDIPAVNDTGYYENDPYASMYDIRKAGRVLGWVPRDEWQDFEQLEF